MVLTLTKNNKGTNYEIISLATPENKKFDE